MNDPPPAHVSHRSVEGLPPVETIMKHDAPALLRYAARLVNDPDAAQDVVQQVMIRYASLEAEKQPQPSKLKAWLYRSVHNQAVDLIRSDQRRKTVMEHHSVSLSIRDRMEWNHNERLQEVLHRVHLLPENERQVLLLRLQEGFSYKEIAGVTGLTEGHVGYLLHQAVRTLSTHLRASRTQEETS